MQDMSENVTHCGQRDSGKDDVRVCSPAKKPNLAKNVITILSIKISNDYMITPMVLMWKGNPTNCYSNRS